MHEAQDVFLAMGSLLIRPAFCQLIIRLINIYHQVCQKYLYTKNEKELPSQNETYEQNLQDGKIHKLKEFEERWNAFLDTTKENEC